MEFLKQWREECPDLEFETRRLAFPDGIDRLVTLGPWYWQALDVVVEKGSHSEQHIINFCFGMAINTSNASDKPLMQAFHEHFCYYIYQHRQIYTPRGVLNDNFSRTD